MVGPLPNVRTIWAVATQAHWDAIYSGKETEDLGWYEPSPSTLGLVLRYSSSADAVIDIGGGDSRLADELHGAGYGDITVLDLSEAALERSRSRWARDPESLEDRSIAWIHADVTDWVPPRRWNLWHDRAVFHFLTAEVDRAAYKSAAMRSLDGAGRLVVATFSLSGPEQCAGLPVQRYDAASLADEFAPENTAVEHRELSPRSDGSGDRRPYVAAVFELA